jgi:hypothetical protein
MKTPIVPKQKIPVSRFVPKLNQHIGVLWLWGTHVDKRSADKKEEPLLEVFSTADVTETLRGMKRSAGPRRYATHVAFEAFESVEEAHAYAAEAVTLFSPADQTQPVKVEREPPKDAKKVL